MKTRRNTSASARTARYQGISAAEYGRYHYEDGGAIGDLEITMLAVMSGTGSEVPPGDFVAASLAYEEARAEDGEVGFGHDFDQELAVA